MSSRKSPRESTTSGRQPLGRIAFITTPRFRDAHAGVIRHFIHGHLYSLCNNFEVLTTGTTHEFIAKTIHGRCEAEQRRLIARDTGFAVQTDEQLKVWSETIERGLKKQLPSIQGMIAITYELVEGRLDAVIHLTDWEDLSAKPDSAVLWREANVHNVPIAHDVDTAGGYVAAWKSRLTNASTTTVFPERAKAKDPPLRGIKVGSNVLAMIAHDEMKLEMCHFAVQNASRISQRFDYVLATGTTGRWLRRFMEAAGRSPGDIKKIRPCLSGPYGGDVQIAYAVVRKLCRKIIFFQDPLTSHAHDVDIRLFEQAVLASDVEVQLATSPAGARLIVGE